MNPSKIPNPVTPNNTIALKLSLTSLCNQCCLKLSIPSFITHLEDLDFLIGLGSDGVGSSVPCFGGLEDGFVAMREAFCFGGLFLDIYWLGRETSMFVLLLMQIDCKVELG